MNIYRANHSASNLTCFFVFLKGSTENGVQSKQTDCLYLLKNKINPETIRWCIAQKPNLGF